MRTKPAKPLNSLLFFLLLTLGLSNAEAALPPTLDYQAFLTNDSGAPVDGTVDLVFNFYNVAVGGIPLLSQALPGQNVNQGVLSVELGPFPAGFFDEPLWIGLVVETDSEMIPRRPVTSTGFAFKAQDANTLEGSSASSLDQSAHVTDTANPHNVTAAQVGAADAGALTAHIGNLSNPHSVTAAQTGAASSGDLSAHAGDPSAHHLKTATFPELSGQIADGQIPALIARDAEIVPTMLANDGSGSGLDADLLDGLNANAFMPIGTDLWVNVTGDIMTGSLGFTGGYFQVIDINTSGSSSWLRWEENDITRGFLGYVSGNTFWSGGVETPDAFALKGVTAMHLGDDQLVMTIDNNKVGIGTTTPVYLLDIQGDISSYLVHVDNNTTSGPAFGIFSNANAYDAGSDYAYGGIFYGTGGSSAGETYGIYTRATAYGTSSAYGVYSNATGGTTTGNEYAFYGVGKGYFSQDLDVNGSVYMGYQRVTGLLVSLNSTAPCGIANSGTCYYAAATVSCPTGKVATGGGCDCSSSYNCYIGDSYQNSDTSWYCRGVASAAGYSVTPSVACARMAN